MEELDNEIHVLRNLYHKNILRYYGFDKIHPSSMYIFMEYMPGVSVTTTSTDHMEYMPGVSVTTTSTNHMEYMSRV